MNRMLKSYLKYPLKRLPLQLILIVPFTLQILTLSSVVIYFSHKSGKSAVEDLANRLLVNASREIVHHLKQTNIVESDLSAFLRELHFSESGESFIVEGSGDLVAMSSQSLRTQAIAQALPEHLGDRYPLAEEQTLSIKIDGEKEFIRVTPDQTANGLDWLVVVAIAESDFAAEIQSNTHRTLLLVGISILVVIATGGLTSQAIAAPIKRLSQASVALAEGTWEPSLPQENLIAEIALLSESFYGTATQLQSSLARIAKTLAESEEKFATIFRTSPDPMAIVTLSEARILEANNSQLEFLGYTREEIIGHTTVELQVWVNLEDRQQFREILQSVGRVSNLEVPLKNKHGKIKTVLVSAELCELQGQNCAIVVTKDITERKQLEISLQASEQELKRILNSVSGAITNFQVYPNYHWQLNQVSNGSEIISGYTPAELMADPELWNSCIYPGDWEAIEEELFANIFSQKTGRYEYRIYDKMGNIRWIYQTNSSTWDEYQQCWIVTAISLDISDRKHLELELQQAKETAEAANQAKSTFLANMSHELRTPLNAILGYPQLLIDSPQLSSEDRRFVEIIQDSGEYLLNLINQILDLSKIEAGRITFNPSNLKISGLLENLEIIFRNRAELKQLDLNLVCTRHIPDIIYTDGVKLQQILVNLLNNAIKFTPSGSVGLIIKLVETNQERLQFIVTDTGVGIAPQELETLFQPFVQTKSGQETQEGTGLGLVISQKFVELLGGKLIVTSVLGEGTQFQFDIPITEPSSFCSLFQSTFGEEIALAPDQPQYRILVVEDNQASRQLLVTMLEKFGFDVREAVDGEEAIAQWQTWQPDLIFMDIRMPKLNGDEATQIIRQQASGDRVIIIAVTASAFEEDRNRFLNLGCNDFIRKPFKIDELIRSLKQYLHVEFVEEKISCLSPETTLTSNHLTHLSEVWRAQFEQAMVYGDFNQMLDLVNQLEHEDQTLITALRELVEGFKLEELFALLDQM